MARTFTLTGSDGDMVACADTGVILSRDTDARGRPVYPHVRRVDVAEWRAFYPGEELEGVSMDWLDIGTFDRKGRLDPAEPDFRAELARIRAEA